MLTGTVYAIAAIVVTSHYQIWVGTEQKTLECNSQQLLLYQAPVSAMMLLFTIPVFDDVSFLSTYVTAPIARHPHVNAARCPPHGRGPCSSQSSFTLSSCHGLHMHWCFAAGARQGRHA